MKSDGKAEKKIRISGNGPISGAVPDMGELDGIRMRADPVRDNAPMPAPLTPHPNWPSLREDALALIEQSARKLVALVHFARVAFGAATTSERFPSLPARSMARPRLVCAGVTTLGLPSTSAKCRFMLGNFLTACTMA